MASPAQNQLMSLHVDCASVCGIDCPVFTFMGGLAAHSALVFQPRHIISDTSIGLSSK
jgi:hypothetical protein